ncbi:MAG: SagB/ThcOx family dehydrogenase [Spirochaetaceae bacterium]|nr:MAG: SagB/ThcOx family dehydrogenase [Spirochaetaceae bacterium]
MTKGKIFVLCLFLATVGFMVEAQDTIALPSPRYDSEMSVEQALNSRKTVRQFKAEAIELGELSQLLWAAGGGMFDGVTSATRTYPSAGGIYPLGIYVVAGWVAEVDSGIYQYLWKDHALKRVKSGDFRQPLASVALRQGFIAQAPVIFIITANYRRTEGKYGQRGRDRYVPLDAGHASQNLHLQAAALNLATATVGAFSDGGVNRILNLDDEEPILIIPVGRPLDE